MANRETVQLRLEARQKALDAANAAYIALLSGQVQSYTIGSRNLTRLDLSDLEETIRRLEKEIDEMEEMLRGGKRRKAVVDAVAATVILQNYLDARRLRRSQE